MLPIKHIKPEKLWLLFSIALILIPHFINQKPIISLLNLAFVGWRLLYEMQIIKLPKPFVRAILALLTFVLVAFLHKTVFGLFAGSALLTVMLCLKLLEMHTWRDKVVVISLSYFVTVTNFLYNQSLLMGFYLLVVVIMLTATLIAYNRRASRISEQFNILRFSTAIVVQSIPLTLLLFFLFPRIPGPLWNLPDDAHSGLTGLSDSMTPGQISQLSNNESVAFRVKFDNQTPESSKRYWRGPVFNHFNGQTWRNTIEHKPDYTSTARILKNSAVVPEQATPITYSVMLEPHNKSWLFGLDIPTQIPSNTFLTTNYELQRKQVVKQLIRYQLISSIDYKLEAESVNNLRQYLHIPKKAAPKARQFVRSLLAQTDPSLDPKMQLLELLLDYIRKQPFYYTQNPPLLHDSPVDEFLFETRKGFCEHYASAFAVLMRIAGAPSRVVTGYLGGEYNAVGDYWAVKQSDAHAWTEIWLESKGWVRIDPTAIIPSNRVEYSTHIERFSSSTMSVGSFQWLNKAWRKARNSWDNVNYYWNIWIIGYDDQQQSNLLSRLGLNHISWVGLSLILFGTLALALIVVALIILKRNKHLQNDPVQRVYARYCNKLKRIGITRNPGETAIQLTQRAIKAKPRLKPKFIDISIQYNALRYNRSSDANLFASFKRSVASLKLN